MNDKNLKEAQKIMKDILKEIVKICDRNNIDYWLDSGTLLGAVRHKGFIPWDDDIDICILKQDYLKLVTALEKELPQTLYLQKPNKKWPYIKVKDKNSIALSKGEKINEGEYQGLYIDVFTMEIFSKKIIYFYNFFLKIERTKFKQNDSKINKLKKVLIIKTGFQKYMSKLFQKLKLRLKNNTMNSNSIVIYEYLWNKYHKADSIFPLKTIEFEKEEYKCPKKPEDILIKLYGKNYLELPPLDKRGRHFEMIKILKNSK